MTRGELLDWMRDRGLFLVPGRTINEVVKFVGWIRRDLKTDLRVQDRLITEGLVVRAEPWSDEPPPRDPPDRSGPWT